jgi:hypothetical protein
MGAPKSQAPYCVDRHVEAWPLPPTMDRTGKNIYLTMDVSNNSDIGLADTTAITSGTAVAKRADK